MATERTACCEDNAIGWHCSCEPCGLCGKSADRQTPAQRAFKFGIAIIVAFITGVLLIGIIATFIDGRWWLR
jgi:hypothetical protein